MSKPKWLPVLAGAVALRFLAPTSTMVAGGCDDLMWRDSTERTAYESCNDANTCKSYGKCYQVPKFLATSGSQCTDTCSVDNDCQQSPDAVCLMFDGGLCYKTCTQDCDGLGMQCQSVSLSSGQILKICLPGTGDGSTSKDHSSGACTTPPVYNCGTSAAGTIACLAGKVCCLSPGCDSSALDPYTANGAVSSCSTPVAPNGGSAQCPSPAIQLCANNSACPAGYRCDPMKYYCVPA